MICDAYAYEKFGLEIGFAICVYIKYLKYKKRANWLFF